ncbi:hypothetical protein [Flavobacterium sp. GT3P67]|nr:hypothetical protein [Flavobacterium sp. GT3P67]
MQDDDNNSSSQNSEQTSPGSSRPSTPQRDTSTIQERSENQGEILRK